MYWIKLMAIMCVIFLISCTKAGKGGKAKITGYVLHHTEAIPNAIVYIAYGEEELPGTKRENFDDNVISSSLDASFSFSELEEGAYYIYAEGIDANSGEDVVGGVPVKISASDEVVQINLPVTEGAHGH